MRPSNFILLALTLTASAQAGESILLDRRADFGQEIKAYRFRIDSNSETTWAEVDYSRYVDTSFDRPPSVGDQTIRMRNPRLFFDPKTMQVVLGGESEQRTVCSQVSVKNVPMKGKYWVFQDTGRCRLYGTRVIGKSDPEAPTPYWYETYLEALE